MIVDEGKIALLECQYPTLVTYLWHLLATDEPVTADTVVGDLTEPVWDGYAPFPMGTLSPAVIVAGRARTSPTPLPSFDNAEAFSVTVYGYFLTDDTGLVLIAAHNFGATVIPAGQSLALAASVTDTNET